MTNSTQNTWWREPLLHFIVLGAVIFAVDRYMTPAVDESRLIVIDTELEQELIAEFEKFRGRAPSPEELDELIDAWIDDEVIYREGLTLGLDRGDEMIRGQVRHKMWLLILNTLDIESPSRGQLQQWLQQNHQRYDRPKSLSFALARVEGRVANSQDRARQAVLALNNRTGNSVNGAQPSPAAGTQALSNIQAAVFRERPRDTIATKFGDAFATALEQQPLRKWSVIEGKAGWYVVRLEGIKEGIAADFRALQQRIEADWLDQERRRRAREALREMRAGYVIQRGAGS